MQFCGGDSNVVHVNTFRCCYLLSPRFSCNGDVYNHSRRKQHPFIRFTWISVTLPELMGPWSQRSNMELSFDYAFKWRWGVPLLLFRTKSSLLLIFQVIIARWLVLGSNANWILITFTNEIEKSKFTFWKWILYVAHINLCSGVQLYCDFILSCNFRCFPSYFIRMGTSQRPISKFNFIFWNKTFISTVLHFSQCVHIVLERGNVRIYVRWVGVACWRGACKQASYVCVLSICFHYLCFRHFRRRGGGEEDVNDSRKAEGWRCNLDSFSTWDHIPRAFSSSYILHRPKVGKNGRQQLHFGTD